MIYQRDSQHSSCLKESLGQTQVFLRGQGVAAGMRVSHDHLDSVVKDPKSENFPSVNDTTHRVSPEDHLGLEGLQLTIQCHRPDLFYIETDLVS